MSKLSNKNSGAIVFTDLKRPSVKIGYALIIIIMVLCSVICVFPPLWVMISSLKDIKEFLSIPPTIIPRSFHPEKLIETWNMMNFTSSYLNTLWVAIGSVVCAIVFNKTIAGKSYIYPLIPFHFSELKKRFLRGRLPVQYK